MQVRYGKSVWWHSHRALPFVTLILSLFAVTCFLTGCSSSGGTSGASYSIPESINTASYDATAATTQNGAGIDTSQSSQGYVGVAATNANRLKFQVTLGQMSYNYDIPNDGTPAFIPLQMGNGSYSLRVMQNTSGNSYVEICAVSTEVSLATEYEPFLHSNIYCNFSESSAVVAKARELAAGAENEGDVLEAVYTWIIENISYDTDKAASLQNASGYIPNPDETLAQGSGICFDYASLAAAMLRSLGIPTKIITGYVSPGNIYHAWNMVYLDGTWKSANIDVESNTWSLIDTTFAAGGNSDYVGDGTSYAELYTY